MITQDLYAIVFPIIIMFNGTDDNIQAVLFIINFCDIVKNNIQHNIINVSIMKIYVYK